VDELIEQAVVALDAIDGESPADAHAEADAILLAFVPEQVRDAYVRLAGDGHGSEARASWWATA
jgi:hypothetical protein